MVMTLAKTQPINIYLAQLTHEKLNQNQNKCFPLAIGYIAAHLLQILQEKISVELFKSPKEFNQALKTKKPDIVILSCYMWNENLTITFANKIKEAYPDVLISLGGPNISLDANKRKDFLVRNQSIDFLVRGDGEFITEEIVKHYLGVRSINKIKSKLFPFTDSLLYGEFRQGPEDGEYRLGISNDNVSMDEFPSPYLTGLFDKFFKDGETPLLETNRGCPFTCTYCQQGNKYFSRIRFFPPERFAEEIKYISKKIQSLDLDITTIWIADPNFGMYKRDEEVCKAIRECQDKYNFPINVSCSTGKNNAKIILKNTSILKQGSLLLRSSMQSLNEEALKAVKRENINLDTYREIQEDAAERGLDSIADMMLGFPGETLESHKGGILSLLDSGTTEFAQYQTIILKGTRFEQKEYLEEHKIEALSRPIPECCNEYSILGENIKVIEMEEIIIKTSTMTFQEYLEARKFNLIIMIFHN